MAVLRTFARPMLASIFVIHGYDTVLRPERVVPIAEPVVRRIARVVPVVPADTTSAVRLNAGVQLVAGVMLSLGRMPRVSALALAATLLPTTVAGHRFWEVEDDKERAGQRVQFLKNLSMLGGLLITAADTGSKPSLAWRTRHTAKAVRRDKAVGRRAAKLGAVSGAAAHRIGGLVPGH
ncbi:DoxX family protein [Streptomyces sp. SID3343]|uniref:DoxX family protein n=1 Tax=Streptomyces sp. SID3343 TaxID=2690260 RepID=UPI00136E195A|nr:DoxX family protein [Streptomyces sp. SID3343]MYW01042.1 DoxX family membrane protein [Streptomyces sp. SID3343]